MTHAVEYSSGDRRDSGTVTTDLNGAKWLHFDAIAGRTAFIDGLLAEVTRGFRQM